MTALIKSRLTAFVSQYHDSLHHTDVPEFRGCKCHAQMLTRPDTADLSVILGAVLLGVEVWV